MSKQIVTYPADIICSLVLDNPAVNWDNVAADLMNHGIAKLVDSQKGEVFQMAELTDEQLYRVSDGLTLMIQHIVKNNN